MAQGVKDQPAVTINDYQIEVAPKFNYLGSIMTENVSLDCESGKAASNLARLFTRTFLYGSEA